MESTSLLPPFQEGKRTEVVGDRSKWGLPSALSVSNWYERFSVTSVQPYRGCANHPTPPHPTPRRTSYSFSSTPDSREELESSGSSTSIPSLSSAFRPTSSTSAAVSQPGPGRAGGFHTQICSFLIYSMTSSPPGPVCTFASGRQRLAGFDGHQNSIRLA